MFGSKSIQNKCALQCTFDVTPPFLLLPVFAKKAVATTMFKGF